MLEQSIRRTTLAAVAWVSFFGFLTIAIGDDAPTVLSNLDGPVTVHFDDYDVPHIYATTLADAACVLGYLHASNRLWQMDLYRRVASGLTAEILGKDGLREDILVRQLGIRRGCEELWESDLLPDAMRAEFEAYAAGVNARLEQVEDSQLPAPFGFLDYQPEPWTPVDSLVFVKYMGWDQSGTNDDLWFGMMADKLGAAAIEELWPLERPYEIPIVETQATRPSAASTQDSRSPNAHRRVPQWPTRPEGTEQLLTNAWHSLQRTGLFGPRESFGSNNWAVDGSKTKSGKPILANDPHLGFSLPSIWYTAHVSIAGENVAGVTFAGCPVVIIGHNDRLGWGITNMQSDAVDYYIETLDPDDPSRYRHRGDWKPLRRVTEEIPVRGEAAHVEQIDYTVHGPIVYREDRAISLAWTGQGMTTDPVALWKVNRARNLTDFLAALDLLIAPALNLCYADVEGNIAIHPCGRHPLRTRGQGRTPMDGASGDYDWQGTVPRDELPLAVNPTSGFVASANGRPVPLGYPHYLGWMWDPSYRTRRIHDMLSAADGLTVESMKAIQYDTHDKAAEVFLPVLLADLDNAELNADERAARKVLAAWNYDADVDATAPVLWLRWLDHYRKSVWDDEWKSRGIEPRGGSWGFTGNNRREPMLEVLEYITREHPASHWFDDRTTPQREQRADIARRSFQAAVASVTRQFGVRPKDWRWGGINVLRISSLTEQNLLSRGGQEVPGTSFTVNPGSGGGHVGGGASWRMIVDFAHPDQSVGVYPGGQSEDFRSPHYDDQIDAWATGRYLPLHMVSDPKDLPAEAKRRTVKFEPAEG